MRGSRTRRRHGRGVSQKRECGGVDRLEAEHGQGRGDRHGVPNPRRLEERPKDEA